MFSLAHLSTEYYKKEGSEIKGKRTQGIFHGRTGIKKILPSVCEQDSVLLDPLKADSRLDNFIIREFEKCTLGMQKDILIFCKCESKIKQGVIKQ